MTIANMPATRQDALIDAYRQRVDARVLHILKQQDEILVRLIRLEAKLDEVVTAQAKGFGNIVNRLK